MTSGGFTVPGSAQAPGPPRTPGTPESGDPAGAPGPLTGSAAGRAAAGPAGSSSGSGAVPYPELADLIDGGPMPLRVLRLVEWLDVAAGLLRRVPGVAAAALLGLLLLKLAAVAVLAAPGGGLTNTARTVTLTSRPGLGTSLTALGGSATSVVAALVLNIVGAVGLLLATALAAAAIARGLRGQDTRLAATARALRPRWRPLLTVAAGSGLLLGCGQTLVLPGLLLRPLLVCATAAVAVEGSAARAGWARGWALGRRGYGRLLGALLLSGSLGLLLEIAPAVIAAAGRRVHPDGTVTVAQGARVASLLLGQAVSAVVLAFQAAVAAVGYLQVRIRTEALDLVVLDAALAGRAGLAGPPRAAAD